MDLRRSLTVSRTLPPWIRRALMWAGVLLGVVVAGLVVTGVVLEHRVQTMLRNETWAPAGSPPPRLLVNCAAGQPQACAEKAANRVGVPVAWMTPPTGVQLRWFLAIAPSRSQGQARDGYAYEEMSSDHTVLELFTQPAPGLAPSPGELKGAQTVNGVSVRIFDSGSVPRTVTFVWTMHGVSYQLFVGPVHIIENELPSTDDLLRLIGDVRYSAPSRGG